jgi:hypothetical protein
VNIHAMDEVQLRELVFAMRWAALDLAQHLDFTNKLLSPPADEDPIDPRRRKAYEQARDMAYALCGSEWPNSVGGLMVFGEHGLELPDQTR